jgi:hypothetical protein
MFWDAHSSVRWVHPVVLILLMVLEEDDDGHVTAAQEEAEDVIVKEFAVAVFVFMQRFYPCGFTYAKTKTPTSIIRQFDGTFLPGVHEGANNISHVVRMVHRSSTYSYLISMFT